MPLELSGDIAGLGKIVQIVRATDSTDRSTTSGTPSDVTGMSVTITPKKSDSAIIVIAACDVLVSGSTAGQNCHLLITDSSNNSIVGAGSHRIRIAGGATEMETAVTIIGYATPATTSATTYKLRFFVNTGTTTGTVRNGSSTDGQMYAIEVAA